MMKCNAKTLRLLQVLAIAVLVLSCLTAPTYGGNGLPADTTQVFGVGARADAMGNAFVAVANDASATFWNPAGLSLLPSSEVTSVYKGLAGFTQSATKTVDSVLDPPEPVLEEGDLSTTGRAAGSGLTFVSITTPLGTGIGRKGTIGLSRALVGYADLTQIVNQEFEDVLPGDVKHLYMRQNKQVEVYYNTLTYGWRSSPRLRLGAGFVVANTSALIPKELDLTEITYAGDESNPERYSIEESVDVKAKGYGGTVGMLWSPQITKNGAWTVGTSYTSKIQWDWQGEEIISEFGDERPDLLLLGINFRGPVQGSETMDQAQWSLQLSRSGSANIGTGDGYVAYHPVWNFAFGGEYEIHRVGGDSGAGIYYPIRYGLFTNRSTNSIRFDDETWLTLGFGAGRADKLWQAEFAYQHALRTQLSLASFSGVYRF